MLDYICLLWLKAVAAFRNGNAADSESEPSPPTLEPLQHGARTRVCVYPVPGRPGYYESVEKVNGVVSITVCEDGPGSAK